MNPHDVHRMANQIHAADMNILDDELLARQMQNADLEHFGPPQRAPAMFGFGRVVTPAEMREQRAWFDSLHPPDPPVNLGNRPARGAPNLDFGQPRRSRDALFGRQGAFEVHHNVPWELDQHHARAVTSGLHTRPQAHHDLLSGVGQILDGGGAGMRGPRPHPPHVGPAQMPQFQDRGFSIVTTGGAAHFPSDQNSESNAQRPPPHFTADMFLQLHRERHRGGRPPRRG